MTAPATPVSIRFRAKLDELEHVWTIGGLTSGEGGVVEVPVEVPREAWMHSSQVDYLADLIAMVELDGHRQRTPEAYLAWPDGATGQAVVWTVSEQRTHAPNGVLREELRVGAEPYDRILPNVSDVAQPRRPRGLDAVRDSGAP